MEKAHGAQKEESRAQISNDSLENLKDMGLLFPSLKASKQKNFKKLERQVMLMEKVEPGPTQDIL